MKMPVTRHRNDVEFIMFLLLASLLSVACSSKPAPPVESFY